MQPFHDWANQLKLSVEKDFSSPEEFTTSIFFFFWTLEFFALDLQLTVKSRNTILDVKNSLSLSLSLSLSNVCVSVCA